MNSTLELLKKHFDRQDWHYLVEDDELLIIGLEGHFLRWYAGDKFLCVDVFLNDVDLAENWSKAIAYVEQANLGLILGNLRTDSNVGVVWFHHAIGFPKGELTEALIKDAVIHTLLSCNMFSRDLSEIASAPKVHLQNEFTG